MGVKGRWTGKEDKYREEEEVVVVGVEEKRALGREGVREKRALEREDVRERGR